jgi:hypothetical protein
MNIWSTYIKYGKYIIGVCGWVYWGSSVGLKQKTLRIPGDRIVEGERWVKYGGIFLNDERR